jgi:hypothetical protein
MNTATPRGATTTITLNEGYFSRAACSTGCSPRWWWPAACSPSAAMASYMDVYEKGILFAAMPAHLAGLVLAAAAHADAGGGRVLAAGHHVLPGRGLAQRPADNVFWLKYFLSSQSAILWMSVLFFMSTMFYWLGMFAAQHSDSLEPSARAWPGWRWAWR